MTRPPVTIIIPVYNRAELVSRAIDSVAAQTVRPLQLVVADNASTDGTLQVVTARAEALRSPDFEITVVRETVPGAANARNRGFAEARAPWVMFFDSDDIMLPGHVERALRTACRHPEAEIVGWDVERTDVNGHAERKPFYAERPRWHNLMHGSMATQRYMARPDLFRRAGLWNGSLTVWDDIELADRMLALRPRAVHAGPGITVRVMEQEQSISGLRYAPSVSRALDALRAFDADAPGMAGCLRLKTMILAADCAREGSAEGPRLRAGVLASEPSPPRRAMLRAAYAWQRAGMRGTARVFYPWFNLHER